MASQTTLKRRGAAIGGDVGHLVLAALSALTGVIWFNLLVALTGSQLLITWNMLGPPLLIAALLGGPLTVVVHELGHAAVARRYGWPVKRIAIGRGTAGRSLRVRGVEICVRRYGLAGHTRFEPAASATVGQLRAVASAGMVVNALVASSATLSALLCPAPVAVVLAGVAGINVGTLMGSLTDHPPAMGGDASDGWQLGELRGAPSGQLLAQLRDAEGAVAHLLRRLRDQPGLQPQHLRSTRMQLSYALSLLGRFEDAEPVYSALLEEPLPQRQREVIAASWADAVLSAAVLSGLPPDDETLALCAERLGSAPPSAAVAHSMAMLALLTGRPREAIELCEQAVAEGALDARAQGLVDATVALAHAHAGDAAAAQDWAERVPDSCPFSAPLEQAINGDPLAVAD